jgi:capsular polysaccharide export protein
LKVAGFGFSHYVRMREKGRGLLDFHGVRRGPVLRLARLRSLFKLPSRTREIGRLAFPNESEKQGWAAAELIWKTVERAEAVAVWNGSRDAALAAVHAARAQGKKVVYVENGFLPGTVQMDLQGVNFESSLATLNPEAIEVPESAYAVAQAIVYRQRPLGRDNGAADEPLPPPDDLPTDFVLFAAQVHDDSQIVRFSPDFRSIEDAIRYVAAECAAAGRALVVKEHPSDHGRVDHGPLKASLPEVRFLDRADNAALIAQCGAFVTVNSSLALQAVDAEKPVFTLGDAAYNLPGIAQRIRPPGRLRDALAAPMVDAVLRKRYLAYLAGVALVPFRSRMPTDEDLRGVMQRMTEMLR